MKKVFLLCCLMIFIYSGVFAEWNQVSKFEKEQVFCLIKKDNYIFAATTNGIFRSYDSGMLWDVKSKGITELEIRSLVNSGDTMYAASFGGGIYGSTDSGENWVEKNNGLTNKEVLSVALFGENIFCYTTDGMFRSTDKGENWVFKNKGLPDDFIYEKSICSFAQKDKIIFVGFSGKGIYSSTNSGETWVSKNKNLNDSLKAVYCLKVYKELFIAGTAAGVQVSSDNGDTWKPKNKSIKGSNVYALEILGDHIFAGFPWDGIYHSSDGGENWNRASYFLPDTLISSLVTTEKYIVAGTYYGAILRSHLTEYGISNVSVAENIPENIQIFPNPAEDFITIQTSEVLKTSEVYNVQIFNIFGVEVISNLSAAAATPQEENLKIDVSDLQSGVYYIRIGNKVGKFVKM